MDKYNKEEIADITDREKRCLAFLKEMDMSPAAQVYKQNLGNDVFVDKVHPYLQDIRYDKTPKESPAEDKKSVEA